MASPNVGVSAEPRGISGGHPKALPEASSHLTSTSGCFRARAGEKGVADKGSAHGLPGRRGCVGRWQQRQWGRSVGAEVGPCLSPGRARGWQAPERGSWCRRPEDNAAKQETWGDGAELAEREVVFVFNGFLSHLQFPLLPFAARVMVFKRSLKTSR